MKRWVAILALLALAAAGLSPALAQGDQARLRAVNASPDALPLDVRIGGATAFSDVAYTGVTDYANFAAGPTGIQFAPAGGDPVIDVSTELDADTDYTVLAVGRFDAIEPLVLVDDNSPPAPGQARVRLVHASPTAPPVDVAVVGGQVLFDNVAFKEAAGYASLAAGTYNLEVRQADDDDDDNDDRVLLSVPNLTLNACTVYTIFVMGLLDEQPPLQTVTSTDAVTQCAPGAAPVAPGRVATKAVTQAARGVLTPTTGVTATGVLTPTTTGTPSGTPTGTRTGTPTGTRTSTPTGTPTGTRTGTPTDTATATRTTAVTRTEVITRAATSVVTPAATTPATAAAPTAPATQAVAPTVAPATEPAASLTRPAATSPANTP